jgi:hypothetical protein
MLDYNCRICYEGPEIIKLEAGIALQVFKEGFLICVVIWIYISVSPQSSFMQSRNFNTQDCLTHNNFFQVALLLLLLLFVRSLCLSLRLTLDESPPFAARNVFTAVERRGGEA